MIKMVVNERLTELERKFALGFAKGTLRRWPLTAEQIDRFIEAKKEFLVKTAKSWSGGLREAFAPEVTKMLKLREVVE